MLWLVEVWAGNVCVDSSDVTLFALPGSALVVGAELMPSPVWFSTLDDAVAFGGRPVFFFWMRGADGITTVHVGVRFCYSQMKGQSKRGNAELQ